MYFVPAASTFKFVFERLQAVEGGFFLVGMRLHFFDAGRTCLLQVILTSFFQARVKPR